MNTCLAHMASFCLVPVAAATATAAAVHLFITIWWQPIRRSWRIIHEKNLWSPSNYGYGMLTSSHNVADNKCWGMCNEMPNK
ncbi:unnamed protein product [Ceratitis capitata]|uniref:(Mediterranean fruit fly) hypothetical protein n=1 Tax=Ceratitis capitata TaxID=7213 RepID=A0A811UZK5_CERCA|nr:unnamed protein product [Ceratitis capitata]